MSLDDILASYEDRWAIEIEIRDARALYGLAQDQCRKLTHIIGANTFRLLMAAARTLWFIAQSERQGAVELRRFRPWYWQKVAPSQLDVAWACREALGEAGIFPIPISSRVYVPFAGPARAEGFEVALSSPRGASPRPSRRRAAPAPGHAHRPTASCSQARRLRAGGLGIVGVGELPGKGTLRAVRSGASSSPDRVPHYGTAASPRVSSGKVCAKRARRRCSTPVHVFQVYSPWSTVIHTRHDPAA